jgi:hypothetical protein
LGILAGCLFLDRSSAALGASPDSSAAAFSITRIESRIPPEPLSPWSAVEDEIERLVVRGELPFEARGFRPIDRGELAAWLRASAARGRASASPARRVLLDLLRWDLGWIERAGRGGKARGPKAEAKAWAKAGAKAGAKARNAPWSARGPIAGAKAGAVTPWSARGPGAGADPFTSPRPGTWVRFGADDRLLLLSPYARVMPRFETGREVAWTDSTRLGFRATYFGGRSLVIATGFYAAEVERGRSFADPLVADSDVILHADELTLSARLGALRLRIGRDRHQWGMGASGTLLLSESARPFDFVEYQLRLGERFRFLALTGITDRHAALSTPGSNPGEARFLSAHRLLWTVTPDLALGLSEGARYQADQPGLLYLGGFVPYTLVERLEMQDEPADSTEDFLRNNVLWSVDVSWRMRPGLLFYGEFLADDIATQSSSMPTRGAFQLGVTCAPRWRGWDWTLGAEYTRVSDFTYSVYYQDICRCDWEHQGEALGYALGPDAEVVLLRAGIAPDASWSCKGWLRHVRRGDGAIGRPWLPESTGCDPAGDDACGDAHAWSFDDPARAWSFGLEARYRPMALVWVGAAVEHLVHEEPRSADDPAGAKEWESDTQLRLMLSAGM